MSFLDIRYQHSEESLIIAAYKFHPLGTKIRINQGIDPTMEEISKVAQIVTAHSVDFASLAIVLGLSAVSEEFT